MEFYCIKLIVAFKLFCSIVTRKDMFYCPKIRRPGVGPPLTTCKCIKAEELILMCMKRVESVFLNCGRRSY